MERQFIISERAHLMCPHMQFGICAKINAVFDESAVNSALLKLQGAHPLLRSVIAAEENSGRFYYDVRDELPLSCTVKTDAARLCEDYTEILGGGWNTLEEGLLKVFAYPDEGSFQILFICHHLLCDGRGLLGLVTEFADLYVEGKMPVYSEERLLKSLGDLPEKCGLSMINRLIIGGANRHWRKENHAVSYAEYLDFERVFLRENPVSVRISATDSDALSVMVRECKENGVSLNDLLVARLMLEENTQRVVIAADIRKTLHCYNSGALGNYSSAVSIEAKGKTGDLMTKAKEISRLAHKKISDDRSLMLILSCYFAMVPELIDAAAISVLGGFESKAGRFIGSVILGYDKRNGYSMSNLGKIDSKSISEAVFLPAASPANRMNVGVLTVNGEMNACTIRSNK